MVRFNMRGGGANGLEKYMAFGDIAEGEKANGESSGDESQGLKAPAAVKQFIMTLSATLGMTSVAIAILSIYLVVMSDWDTFAGENGYAVDYLQLIARRTRSADMHQISYS